MLLAFVAAAFIFVVVSLLLAIPFGTGQMFGELYTDAWTARRWRTRPRSRGWRSVCGSAWRWRCAPVRFAVAGPWWQRALRYVIGVVGLFAIWMGLRMIFPHEPTTLGIALRMVRYALAMLWAIVGWPWLFVRIKLGTREEGQV